MEKSRYARVIERKKMRGDNPIEYFLTTGVGSTSKVPEGMMAVEVTQNEKISGEMRNGGRRSRFCYSSQKSE